MTTIEYSQNIPLSAAEVAEVFNASGIRRPTNDLARIEHMLANANLTWSAWHEGRLIGLARALTDFSYCCYLSDLAVVKSYQNQGIGSELIDRIKTVIGEEVALILISSPEAIGYYPRIGFDRIDNGFIIKRNR
ncbi:MAG: GNAT family N-acetyltransferase [Pseudomonadota bacterium]|nr:GNAT family N-acetyltransferase [Pseudomonadota bacterium]